MNTEIKYPSNRYKRICEETGLTIGELDRQRNYVLDTMERLVCKLDTLRTQLETVTGVKPVDHMEAYRQVGLHIESDVGTYVYPFQPRGHGVRGTVIIVTPLGDRFNFSFREAKDETAIHVNVDAAFLEGKSWRSLMILPEATNSLRLVVRPED